MNELTDFSFLHLSQVWSLRSSKISYGSVNMLPSSLVRRCWYVDSKGLLFPSYFFKLHFVHDFSNLTLLFLFIWLNSDSSFRTLHMVYTWSILFYPLRSRQGSKFMDRKNDARPLNQRLLNTCSLLVFLWFLSAHIALVLVLNQQFLIVHASQIFICVGCLDTLTNILKQNIHGLSLHDFCLCKTATGKATRPLYYYSHDF